MKWLLRKILQVIKWLENLGYEIASIRKDVAFERAFKSVRIPGPEAKRWVSVVVVDTEGNILHQEDHYAVKSHVLRGIRPVVPKGYKLVKVTSD